MSAQHVESTRMQSDARKHRLSLARHRALAATFRKRKRAEAISDLTCDRSSAQKFDFAFIERNPELRVIGARQVTPGSALNRNGAQQASVVSSVNHKAARSTKSTVRRPASLPSSDSFYEHASKRFDSSKLQPITDSNPAQEQQHAHAKGAAIIDVHSQYQANPHQTISHQAVPHRSDPYQTSSHQAGSQETGLFQAIPYQQLHLRTAVEERHTAKHDSFRMISNAMAGRSAEKQSPPGHLHYQSSPGQAHTHACTQTQLVCKQHRAVNIAGSAAQPAAHAGHSIPLLPEVTESMEMHLQSCKHRGKASSLLCSASQCIHPTVTPHSLPFQILTHSTTSSAGSARSYALAGDAVQCSAPDLPAGMQKLRDPRRNVDVELPQSASACFPDPPQASTHCRPLTPPQTAPQYSQFLLKGPSMNCPPAGPVGLHVVPSVNAPARASTLQAGFRSDYTVTITPGHRQAWDWSHGPLYSFRAVCRAAIQQRQGLPLPSCSKKSSPSSQQPSIPDITAGFSHHSSSASRPSSSPPAYPSVQFSFQHELLPLCSSSSAQQSHSQRFFRCSPSPTLPVLLPSSLSASPSASLPASPSASLSTSVSLPVIPNTSPFSSSAVKHAVQAASTYTQCQMTHSSSASQALSSPLPWQTNTSFDFPVVCGSPQPGPNVWSHDAVVPNNTCRWGPDPSLMGGDGRTWQQAHMDDPCGAELDLQELQRSTLKWMASELVPAGSYDALFHD